jgi:glucosyl-dolichyl phosphate glucuronosyltransferase
MKISAIICTFNRSESLAKTLNSLAASVVPETCEWEVLVVDNNSSDSTREVAESFCHKYPSHFRYIFEARQGKSCSLNTGIREARGDVLAFTDDDVTVDPAWLYNLTMHLGNGDWAGAAGRILPEERIAMPRWVPRNQEYALAPLVIFDPRLEAGPLQMTPFGANMAFQKRMFAQYGGFRTDLGPGLARSDPQKSEDSEFGHRLLKAGERLRYEPLAVIYHSVPPSRVSKRYFLNWWFDKSRADIRAFGVPPETKWFVAGVPLYLLRRITIWTLRWILALEPSRRFSCKVKVWSRAGEIVETYRRSQARKAADSI